jgi:hypothetical protein
VPRGVVEAVGAAAGVLSGDEGQNWLPSSTTAISPRTERMMTCVRFSIPSFTQAPDRR